MAWSIQILDNHFLASETAGSVSTISLSKENFPAGYQATVTALLLDLVSIRLTTGVVVANRRPVLKIMNGALEILRWPAQGIVGASNDTRFAFPAGASLYAAAAQVNAVHESIGTSVFLLDQQYLEVSVSALQVGDNIAEVHVQGRLIPRIEQP